jgi:hypothetical protein
MGLHTPLFLCSVAGLFLCAQKLRGDFDMAVIARKIREKPNFQKS